MMAGSKFVPVVYSVLLVEVPTAIHCSYAAASATFVPFGPADVRIFSGVLAVTDKTYVPRVWHAGRCRSAATLLRVSKQRRTHITNIENIRRLVLKSCLYSMIHE